MKIISLRVMRGPNYWSVQQHRLVVCKVQVPESARNSHGENEAITNIPATIAALSLADIMEQERAVRSGDRREYYARLCALLASALQPHANPEEMQKFDVLPAVEPGTFRLLVPYEEEACGVAAVKTAVKIVAALLDGSDYDPAPDIVLLERIYRRHALGPSTRSIVDAAQERDIPWRRVNNDSCILFGHGCNQRLIQATMSSFTNVLGVDLAADKEATKKMLREAYIPVPDGMLVCNAEELKEAVETFGFPLAIKPLNGNHGRAVTTNIRDEQHALRAFEAAKQVSYDTIVERFVAGYDYRLLVINYKLEAASLRTPAMVTGNGQQTIEELVSTVNADPARGRGHSNVLTEITIDQDSLALLSAKGYDPQTILPAGEKLYLKSTANISTGGTAEDVTDLVHPDTVFMAERIARLMNLDICGIDLVAEDISEQLNGTNGGVIEVNAAPGFRMHTAPSRGLARNVGAAVIDMLYPPNAPSRIPIVSVTGTNGKTTTTRLIAHIICQSGKRVGYTTTDGIYINCVQVAAGDCSGPASAALVLRDPLVDFAVLECARGGLLRSGLGFDQNSVGIVTNVTEDHMGLDDIHSLQQLADVKSVVVKNTAPDGYAVLNADDELVYAMRDKVRSHVALFSLDGENPRVKEHCDNGGWAAAICDGYFTLCNGNWRRRVAKVEEVPLTFDGRAIAMIKNVLPAILAAALSGADIKTIRDGLLSFVPGTAFTPGRMNLFKINGFEVMVDYVHNTDGFRQLESFVEKVDASNKICLMGCTGDRRDTDIFDMGKIAAEMFDSIIIRHDKDGRGRTNEEITRLIMAGIRTVKPDLEVPVISDELEAVSYALGNANEGDFIVVCSDEIRKSTAFLEKYKQEVKQPEPAPVYMSH